MIQTQRLSRFVIAAAVGLSAAWASAQPAAPAGNVPTPPAATASAPHHMGMHRDGGKMQQHMQERMAKKMAKFKQELAITPAQEGAWNQWTAAMKPPADMGQRMQQMKAQREEMAKLTTPERIDRMRAMRNERQQAMGREMTAREDATKAFYAQLTPAQQKTFDAHAAKMHQRMEHRMHGGPGMMWNDGAKK